MRIFAGRNVRQRQSLPNHYWPGAVEEKQREGRYRSWTLLSAPIPGTNRRRLRIPAPYVLRRYSKLVYVVIALAVGWFLLRFSLRTFRSFKETTPTLVYDREDLQKIWTWEITSGHYPSRRDIPKRIGFISQPPNPAVPAGPSHRRNSSHDRPALRRNDHGPQRIYPELRATPPDVAYPPRPPTGSIADLDIVMNHCDFSQQKYVRDCLEVLQVGAGLDSDNHLRRGNIDRWRYLYTETGSVQRKPETGLETNVARGDAKHDFPLRNGLEREAPLALPPPHSYTPHEHRPLHSECDPDSPHIFHMFWTGPFTDKPYTAILSFLFTQNLHLNIQEGLSDVKICRPQLWLWINPGPAASVPNSGAERAMMKNLAEGEWSSPFLHPRFKDIIHFRLWNTTEQLDATPELADEWRTIPLFRSQGKVVNVPKLNPGEALIQQGGDDMLRRLGSKSANSYDRMSVILSDMARFILCHRYGGIYLDTDTILLRDWEELWGWKGAFAYRWSRIPTYNTAVLRMNRRSALGTFIIRTALRNGLDFHPMSVHQYIQDASLDGLLLRLPDALFDPAWLNTEDYQRDRPPQPYFTEFKEFFKTPPQNGALPRILGFDGFFRGAYSYHYHNFWWEPFDPARNWPDLGARFIDGERRARGLTSLELPSDNVEEDRRDLTWATVLKRTFEAYIRGERPNMYGEWIAW
ncbi:unnamed protein product [Peniophora sp. CBMAI 1063]|nr:unnamed protein product [Peniophora sp. CBMAI 1063]